MRVTVARVDERLFDGEAYALHVPGVLGELSVLSHHMPLITLLKGGTVRVRPDASTETEEVFPIEGGILEVSNNAAVVLIEK